MRASIYVAGSSSEMERARAAMAQVEAAGLRLTCDWVKAIDASLPESFLSLEEKDTHASNDLFAVGLADVLWLLLPETPSAGAWFEFGYFARAFTSYEPNRKRRIVISGAAASDHIFVAWAMARGAQRYQTDGEAAVALGLVKP